MTYKTNYVNIFVENKELFNFEGGKMEILTFTNYKSFIKRIVMPRIYGKVIKIRRKIENLKDFSELLKQIPYNSEKGYVISVSNMRIEMNKGYYSLTFKDFRMTYKDENDIEIENFSFPVMAEIADYFFRRNFKIFQGIRNILWDKCYEVEFPEKLPAEELAGYIYSVEKVLLDSKSFKAVGKMKLERILEIAEKLPFKKCVELKLVDSQDVFSVCDPGWICFAEKETLSSCLQKMSKVKEICDANDYKANGTINWNIVNSVTYLPEKNKIVISLPEYSREDFNEIYKFKKANKDLKIKII